MPLDALTTVQLPHLTTLQVASQMVPLQLASVPLVNTDIVNRVLRTRAAAGVPRSQVGVPISPDGQLTDTVLFEDPSDPNRRLYLPRYELALLAPDQYGVAFEGRGTAGWALVVTLKPVPAPGLDVAGAGQLPHTASVALSYQVPGGGMRELPFDPPVQLGETPEAGLRAELLLKDMRERDAVVRALRAQDTSTQLVVRRAIEVAVLVAGTAIPPGDPGHGEVATVVVDHRIRRMQPRLRDIADLRPIDGPFIEQVQAEPSEPLYRRVPAVLDARVGDAFTFDKDVHAYVYAAVISAAPGEGRAVRHLVDRHDYFQDPDLRNVFYYLHDEYRISRDKKTHKPVLSVEVVPTPEAPEPAKIVVDYVATGVTDPARLAGAAVKLAPKVPKGFDAVELIPLEVRPEQLRYRVRLPRARVTTEMDAGAEASLSLAAIQHTFVTSVVDFQEIYSAIVGAVSTAFQGTLELTLDGRNYRFGILTRAEDFAGDLFQSQDGVKVAAGATVDVTLRNVVESPIRVTAPVVAVVDGDGTHPASVAGVEGPETALGPGTAMTLRVTAPDGVAGEVSVTAEATLVPDGEALWNAILEETSASAYVRPVEVDGGGLFKSADAAGPVEYVVEFEDHDELVANRELRLSPEKPTGTVALPMPIRDLVLADPSSAGNGLEFRYRLRAVHRPPRDEAPTEWATGTSPLFL